MISVIIPLYNAEKSIFRTLESVKNQRTTEVFEIIVINDGSTDGSVREVELFISQNPEMDIKLLHQVNRGVSAARNAGLEASKGEFIALLDSDDVWLPEKTEKQMRILRDENLKTDFVTCAGIGKKILWPYEFNADGLAVITLKKLLLRNEILTPAVIFNRKVLENSGKFDETLRHAEDLNYWYKVAQHNQMLIMKDELIIAGGGKRSFGVSGLSSNLKEMEKGFQKGLYDLYQSGVLNFAQYLLYRIYFRVKYWVRLARNYYYQLKGS